MRPFFRTLLAIVFSFLFFTSSYTQVLPAVTPELRQEANRFYQASDWEHAIKAYERIVSLESENSNAHYRLGNALFNLNKSPEALAHLEKAFSVAPNPTFALTLARAFARVGNKTRAFETLEKSTTIGGILPETLAAEKDFASWQSDPQFKEILKKSDVAVNPCKAGPEFRQFDFWIGEWDVKTPQGQPAGTSSVQLILGQCIILENWTGTGSSGKSFNIYDVNDKKWHQSWVDDKGTFTHYIGSLVNGEMQVTADTIVSGKKTLARMTFSKLPNGDVRQFGQNSTDEGKTWATAFDLIYSKKK